MIQTFCVFWDLLLFLPSAENCDVSQPTFAFPHSVPRWLNQTVCAETESKTEQQEQVPEQFCVCVYPDKFQCETETHWSPKMHNNESNGNNLVVFLYFYDFAE